MVALRLGEVYAKKAKENQGTRTDILQNSAESFKPIDTRAELAKIAHLLFVTMLSDRPGCPVRRLIQAGVMFVWVKRFAP